MHPTLIIGGTAIRTSQDGLVSLNDIHAAAQARDIHVMSLEIARLRPYEHTLKHAVELAEQGRGADALDVLKAALNHPASLYSKQPCCSPEAGN